MMRVLVSGSKGFIGKHVMSWLCDAGHTVRGYDLEKDRKENVLDPYELEVAYSSFMPDVAVHLAAQVFLGPSMIHPQKDAETNIIGTLNMLEASRKYGSKLVFSSSGAVYGSNDRSDISEDHLPEPMSPYGMSKLAAEKYVLLYNKLYDMQNVVFRFSSIYGLGRKKTSVNLILDKAIRQVQFSPEKHDFPVITISGDGSQTRDFTHVSDVSEAVVMATEKQFPPGIYNIGTGTSTSINSLVKIISNLLGQTLITKYVASSKGDPLKNDFNVDKAKHCGFKAKIKLEDGLQHLITEMI